MSFFKDFKEDLSQAVNELLPEEKAEEAKSPAPEPEQPQMVDTFTEDEPVFGKDDIADMLKNIDAVPTEIEPEPVFAAEPAAEPEPARVIEPVIEPEPVVEPEPVAVPEPVIMPEATAPVIETPVIPEPVAVPVSAPIPEPVVRETYEEKAPQETVRTSVTPIFANEPARRSAPINTTMEDFSMETGIIIAGMSIKGDITSEGSLDVQGNVTGNIDIMGKLQITGTIEGNSKADEVFADGAKIVGEINSEGSVKIGESSVVRGNIIAKSAVLAGAVKGDIDVQGPVILDATAIIMGNIKSKSIQINNGAVIEGLCSQCYADVSPVTFFDDDDKNAKVKVKKAE